MKKQLQWIFPALWFFAGSFVCENPGQWVVCWIGAIVIAIFSGIYTDGKPADTQK